jgi:hypothetical protein
MKKLVIAAVALMVSIAATFAQGQVNFANKVAASGINAKIVDNAGAGALTPPYSAGLVVDSSGTFTFVPGSAAAFKTGAAAGYIAPSVLTIPGHDVNTSVTLRVIGFKGDTTDAAAIAALGGNHALNFGLSNPVTVTLGGGTVLPPDMVGLTGFAISVPEPSTIAFGLLGAAALLIRRRK